MTKSQTSALALTETVKGVIAKKGSTVSDVFKAVAAAAVPTEFRLQPPLPGSPKLSPEVTQVLKGLSGTLASLELPSTYRQLTPAEQEDVIQVVQDVRAALKGLKKSEDQLKAAAFNHFDAVALADPEVEVTDEVQRTKEGWLILPDDESLAVDDLDTKLTREVSQGSVSLAEPALRALAEHGDITHREYLSMTTATRVTDEDKVMAAIKKNPELAIKLAKATSATASKASLYLRPND